MISFFCLSLVVKVIGHLGVELLKSLLGTTRSTGLSGLGLGRLSLRSLGSRSGSLGGLGTLGLRRSTRLLLVSSIKRKTMSSTYGLRREDKGFLEGSMTSST